MSDAPLPSLSLPVVEREPTFQAAFDARIAQLRGLLTTAGITWDTWMLRSDPLNNLCRHAAYGDLLYAQALNDTFRATLLDFGSGGDLDAQAFDWDMERASGEIDGDLRRRLRERKKGQGGFTESWYMRWAFAADPQRVDDVAVRGDGKGGVVVSILSKDNGGLATPALLAAVAAKLTEPLILGDNDHVEVVPAVIKIVNVTADIWLLPEAPQSALQTAETELRSRFAAERRLGWDLTSDWCVAALRASGIKRVNLLTPAPNTSEGVASDEAVALGSVTLSYRGRAY